MRVGWLIVSCFLVFFLVGTVLAQTTPGGSVPGGGNGNNSGAVTVTNNSPTPLNGFTSFTITCNVIGPQKGKICAGGTCDISTPELCFSPFTTSTTKSCVGLVSESHWGYSTASGVCCNLSSTSTCTTSTTTSWIAGVIPSAPISVPTSTDFDVRRVHAVYRSINQLVMVLDSDSGAYITTSSDNGLTWTAPITVLSLFPVSNPALPAGYTLSQVEAVHPALTGLVDDSTVYLSFVTRNKSSKKGSIFVARCDSGNCSQGSNWSDPVPLLDAAVDQEVNVQGNGLDWKYQFSFPDIRATNEMVHVVFDDGETDGGKRIHGIFHRACEISSGCLNASDWFSPSGDPDVIASSNSPNNGYPHAPSLMTLPNNHVAVGWVDFVTAGGGLNQLFVSEYSPSSSFSGDWSAPLPIANPNSYSSPTLTGTSGDWRILSPTSSGLKAFQCSSTSCSSPASWNDISSALSGFSDVTNLSHVTMWASPSDFDKWVVMGDGISSSFQRVVGMIISNGVSSPLRFLSPPSTNHRLAGVSDPTHSYAFLSSEWNLYSTVSGTTAYGVSTNVLNASNSSPVIGSLTPQNNAWSNPSGRVTPVPAYSELVNFSVQDVDAADKLYVSFYLSDTQGGFDYPLVVLHELTSTSSTACANKQFSSMQPCSLSVPVYVPTQSVKAPDGPHYLVMRVHDSGGGETVSTYSNPITLDGLPTALSVTKPLTGETWTSKTTNQFIFSASSPAYIQSIKLAVNATAPAGSVDLGTIDMASWLGPSNGCTKTASLVSCTIPFNPPSTLTEGSYTLAMNVKEDGYTTASVSTTNMVLDFQAPHLTASSPAGNLSTFPSSLSFTLVDYSGVDAQKPVKVSVNGTNLPGNASCTPGTGNSLTCSISIANANMGSFQGASQTYEIGVNADDLVGNSGSSTYSFSVGSGSTSGTGSGPGATGSTDGPTGSSGGGGGPSAVSTPGDLVTVTPNGDVEVNGTGIVIPRTIVETVNSVSRGLILTASNLVEVTGPSAYAIFIGLCAIAGLVSDVVFRRVFSQIVTETQHQRERVLRTALVGVFVVLPLVVGLQFSLPVGFIFAVLEIVCFVGAAYGYKLIQYYQTFGFKPIEGVSAGSSSPNTTVPPLNHSPPQFPPRPPL